MEDVFLTPLIAFAKDGCLVFVLAKLFLTSRRKAPLPRIWGLLPQYSFRLRPASVLHFTLTLGQTVRPLHVHLPAR